MRLVSQCCRSETVGFSACAHLALKLRSPLLLLVVHGVLDGKLGEVRHALLRLTVTLAVPSEQRMREWVEKDRRRMFVHGRAESRAHSAGEAHSNSINESHVSQQAQVLDQFACG
jgi:hypothetical protein